MTRKTIQWLLLGLLSGAVLGLASCAKKIELTPMGSKVEFVENTEVINDKLADREQCKLVEKRKINVQTGPKLMGDKEKEAKEARIIRARNAAAIAGANIVVRDGELVGATQAFKAYKCKVQ